MEASFGTLMAQLLVTAVAGVVCYHITDALSERRLASLVKVSAIILSATKLLQVVTKAVLAIKEFFEPAMRWLEKWGG